MTALHPIVAFCRDRLRLELWPEQAAILSAIYTEAIRTAVMRLGRRSGKDTMAAAMAAYEATVNAALHLAAVQEGEQVAIVVVASSRAQARVTHRLIRMYLRRAGAAIARDTTDEIELASGIVVMTLPCHAATGRGAAVAVVILSEAAWFVGRDESPLNPKEVWDALVPATAQFPAGRVLVLSTPRWSVGWFADTCERAASGELPDWRHWHRTTAQMNPGDGPGGVSPDFLESERRRDPSSFRREYEAEFDSAIGAALDADAVRGAIRAAGDLPPSAAVDRYVLAMDPAYTGDTWALLVGHRDGPRLIVDRIRGWTGTRGQPVQVEATLDEVALLSQAYHNAPVITDQSAAAIIKQRLRARGVTVIERAWTNEGKVDALAALRRVLYAGQLEIPRHRDLVAELVGLEQRAMPSGRPRIAAPPGGHDDYATTLMALAAHLAPPAGVRVLARDPETGRMAMRLVEAAEWQRSKDAQRERRLAWAGHFD